MSRVAMLRRSEVVDRTPEPEFFAERDLRGSRALPWVAGVRGIGILVVREGEAAALRDAKEFFAKHYRWDGLAAAWRPRDPMGYEATREEHPEIFSGVRS